jgi:hypothetical protein
MALSFNGTTARLLSSAPPITAYPFSIFAWIKPTTTAVSGMAVGIGNGAGSNEAVMYSDGGNGVKNFARRVDGTNSTLVATTTQQTTWQPCLVVFESDVRRQIYYSSGAVVLTTIVNTIISPSTFTRLAVGVRPSSGNSVYFSGDVAEVAVWSSVLEQANFDALAAGALPETVLPGSLVDAWSLVSYNDTTQIGVNGTTLAVTGTSLAGSHPVSRTVPNVLAGTATLAGITASGGFISVESGMAGAATLAGVTASGGMGLAPGTLTSPVLKNNTDTVLANVTGIVANIYHPTTGALVVRKTGLTSSAVGVVTITDAALAAGVSYVYELDLSAAGLGRRLPVGVAA